MEKEKQEVYEAALLLALKDLIFEDSILHIKRIKRIMTIMEKEYNVVATKEIITDCIKNAKKVIVINKL